MKQTFFDLAAQAFQSDEFAELFSGAEKYRMDTRYLPADVPVDCNTMMSEGVYGICALVSAQEVADKLVGAIRKLLSGTPEEVWSAYNICWSQLFYETQNTAPFSILSPAFRQEIRDAVRSREADLKACRRWEGSNKKDGLWEAICRADTALKRFLEVSLL